MNTQTTPSASLLLVDDDESLLRLMTIRLEQLGYHITSATDGKQALKLTRQQGFDAIISDIRMPGMDGMALNENLQIQGSQVPVILMTAHGTIDDAIHATKQGVLGFLTKPVDHEQLQSLLEQAIAQSAGQRTAKWRENIISRSPEMEKMLAQAYTVAQKDVSLLICGSSGAGKELLAKSIHQASGRSQEAFVAINCGALPENLLESELFGHAKGAFTGAVSEHKGLFQQASGGTLFLDEIGDMPLPLQVKLLRALQERRIRPVGGRQEIDIDVRLISATHRNLVEEMDKKQFREDLYYRINVLQLTIPDLRERAEDIPALSRYLLKQSAKRLEVNASAFSDDGMALLTCAPWPGNVRQLVNVIEQCVALTNSPVISAHLVSQALSSVRHSWPELTEAREAFEQDYLVRILKMTDGNITRAAELAGRNRSDMHKLMKKHGLNGDDYR